MTSKRSRKSKKIVHDDDNDDENNNDDDSDGEERAIVFVPKRNRRTPMETQQQQQQQQDAVPMVLASPTVPLESAPQIRYPLFHLQIGEQTKLGAGTFGTVILNCPLTAVATIRGSEDDANASPQFLSPSSTPASEVGSSRSSSSFSSYSSSSASSPASLLFRHHQKPCSCVPPCLERSLCPLNLTVTGPTRHFRSDQFVHSSTDYVRLKLDPTPSRHGYGVARVSERVDTVKRDPIVVKKFSRDVTLVVSQACFAEAAMLARVSGHPNIALLLGASLANPEQREELLTPLFPETTMPAPVSAVTTTEGPKYERYALLLEHAGEKGLDQLFSALGCAEDAAFKMAQVLQALEYTHSLGVVHADLKPANIMADIVTGEVRIIDFGQAFIDFQSMNQPFKLVSPKYRPPEAVFGGVAVDSRLDIWSAAACFFDMLGVRDGLVRKEDYTKESYVLSVLLAASRWLSYDACCKNFAIDSTVSHVDVRDEYYTYVPAVAYRKAEANFLTVAQRLEPTKLNLRDRSPLFFFTDEQRSDLVDVLSAMLEPLPCDRATATQALDMPFFTRHWPAVRDRIAALRNFSTKLRNDVLIADGRAPRPPFPNCSARREAVEYACRMLEACETTLPYRILMHAVDLFDRYLETRCAREEDPEGGGPDPSAAVARFVSCFHIAACFSGKGLTTFEDLKKSDAAVHALADIAPEAVPAHNAFMDYLLTSCVGLDLYRTTPFELTESIRPGVRFTRKGLAEYIRRSLKRHPLYEAQINARSATVTPSNAGGGLAIAAAEAMSAASSVPLVGTRAHQQEKRSVELMMEEFGVDSQPPAPRYFATEAAR